MRDDLDSSVTSLVRLVRGLGRTADVLYVGAHPDDEDSALIAMLAQGDSARVVCWSATRGEGGQNRVTSYAGSELGVYRTWESTQARAIDGGESWFGPFYDDDYSKSGAETLEKWGRDRLVAEIVRAIRAAQPQIVISAWRGDDTDGHGHHAAVGIAVHEAFVAAGDPARFAEFERVGLAAWQARKLYVGMRSDWAPGQKVQLGVRRPELEVPGCLRLNAGTPDPIAHVTYAEIGAIALNQHLTQGTTSVPVPGDHFIYLRLDDVAPASGPDVSEPIFAGIDCGLTSLVDHAGGGAEVLRRELEVAQRHAALATECFRLDETQRAAPALLDLLACLADLEEHLSEHVPDESARVSLARYLGRKCRDAEVAAARCLGLRLVATVDRAAVTPGESMRLSARLLGLESSPEAQVEFEPVVMIANAGVNRANAGDAHAALYDITVPADAGLSCPYWLRHAARAYSYVWPEEVAVGEPFDEPPITVRCSVRIAGRTLHLSAPALFEEAFAGGYRRLATAIVPPISCRPLLDRYFLRTQGESQEINLLVSVVGHDQAVSPIEGVLEVSVPDGWTASPFRTPVRLRKAGDSDTIEVSVTVPPGEAAGCQTISFGMRCGDRLYESSITTVMQGPTVPGSAPDEGTFVRREVVAEPSAVVADLIDVAVHDSHTYGYVSGVGDDMPRVLSGLGLSVELLSDDALLQSDLGRYDVICIGPNAFLSRDGLRRSSGRLLDYVQGGGTLLVQYQGYRYASMAAAPYPFSYAEPHDRVTQQDAPVQFLNPDHYLLRFPNRIVAGDFDGWVRDRGMYFFGEWDPAYEPLLACSDPGESQKWGGLLVAAYGRGAYVYCGYTLFRQVAAGVPGAFRLLANLLALPEGRLRERMEHLRHVSIFETLDEAQLREVARIAIERKVADGEYLTREGDIGSELYVIKSGKLEVLQGVDERYLRTCVAGEPVGELAAITRSPRTASMRADGAAEVLAIRADEFLDLLRSDGDVAEGTVTLLARRLYAAMADPGSLPPDYERAEPSSESSTIPPTSF
ncbi:MAG TPA: cyclic nucleotide-binding domain-containing protein [Candidatus Limnocylindrales bacterium]|nr:cyclic nucleotide-binding domain-containing protein [Candidatus Limnocylindrales bacterium]